MLPIFRKIFFFSLLLSAAVAHSQNESYVGGFGDGQGKAVVENSLGQPIAYQPFIGGPGDGHGFDFLENPFDLPVAFQPFIGSSEDGYASDSLILFNPRSYINMYYPYAGDSGDGWANYPVLGIFIPLPLELLDFYGEQKKEINMLRWTTSNEVQTAYFIIERGEDGLHFDAIGKTAAAGNYSGNRDYLFEDLKPLSGHNYYRLKMVDQDGSLTYSNIILLRSYGAGNKLMVFPNPTTQSVNIRMERAIRGQEAMVQLTDLKGSVLQQRTALNGRTLTLNMEGYSPGVYLIRMIADGEQSVWKIIKQ